MFFEATPLIFERAHALRLNPTPAEAVLWNYLRTKPYGYKFRRQHPIGPFIADFYAHAAKLVIEVDGSIHNTKEVALLDKSKQWSIEKERVKVLRFKNEDVINNIASVISTITHYLSGLHNIPK